MVPIVDVMFQLVEKGRYWDFVMYIILMAVILYYVDAVNKGKPLPNIRSIPALEAIREGVGRCVEINKPVHFSFGQGAPVTGTYVGQTIAGMGVLSYTCGLCAELEARLIFHLPGTTAAIPIMEGIIREAYAKAGKPELFDRGRDMFYHTGSTSRFIAGMAATFFAEGVGMNVMVGRQYTTIYPALEAAKLQGAIVIGGTARWTAMYIFALTCDYIFIGEELFAAGARCTDNPYMIGSLACEEVAKYFCMGVIVLCLIIGLVGGVDLVADVIAS